MPERSEQKPTADEGPVQRMVMAPVPKRADAPDELPTPGSCNVPPLEVWPVPDSGTNGLEPGPWMPGEWRPAREGKYLRYWPGSDDLAFSFWRGSLWHAGPFFDSKSDDQELAWRGGVKKRHNVEAERPAAFGGSVRAPCRAAGF